MSRLRRSRGPQIYYHLVSRELGLPRSGAGFRYSGQCEPLLGFAEEKASLPNKILSCEASGLTRSTLLMTISPDGAKLASSHGDHSIRVSDVHTGKCLRVLHGHPRTPWCLAFHPVASDILGSGCLAGEVRIWDIKGGGSELYRCIEALSITSLTFHPLDNVIVFAVGNKIKFWDWKQPEPFAVCQTKYGYEKIRWIKFDPLGLSLFTAIANSSIIIAPDEHFSVLLPPSTYDMGAYERRRRALISDRNPLLSSTSSRPLPTDPDEGGARQEVGRRSSWRPYLGDPLENDDEGTRRESGRYSTNGRASWRPGNSLDGDERGVRRYAGLFGARVSRRPPVRDVTDEFSGISREDRDYRARRLRDLTREAQARREGELFGYAGVESGRDDALARLLAEDDTQDDDSEIEANLFREVEERFREIERQGPSNPLNHADDTSTSTTVTVPPAGTGTVSGPVRYDVPWSGVRRGSSADAWSLSRARRYAADVTNSSNPSVISLASYIDSQRQSSDLFGLGGRRNSSTVRNLSYLNSESRGSDYGRDISSCSHSGDNASSSNGRATGSSSRYRSLIEGCNQANRRGGNEGLRRGITESLRRGDNEELRRCNERLRREGNEAFRGNEARPRHDPVGLSYDSVLHQSMRSICDLPNDASSLYVEHGLSPRSSLSSVVRAEDRHGETERSNSVVRGSDLAESNTAGNSDELSMTTRESSARTSQLHNSAEVEASHILLRLASSNGQHVSSPAPLESFSGSARFEDSQSENSNLFGEPQPMSQYLSEEPQPKSHYLPGEAQSLSQYLSREPQPLAQYFSGEPRPMSQYLPGESQSLSQYISRESVIIEDSSTSSTTASSSQDIDHQLTSSANINNSNNYELGGSFRSDIAHSSIAHTFDQCLAGSSMDREYQSAQVSRGITRSDVLRLSSDPLLATHEDDVESCDLAASITATVATEELDEMASIAGSHDWNTCNEGNGVTCDCCSHDNMLNLASMCEGRSTDGASTSVECYRDIQLGDPLINHDTSPSFSFLGDDIWRNDEGNAVTDRIENVSITAGILGEQQHQTVMETGQSESPRFLFDETSSVPLLSLTSVHCDSLQPLLGYSASLENIALSETLIDSQGISESSVVQTLGGRGQCISETVAIAEHVESAEILGSFEPVGIEEHAAELLKNSEQSNSTVSVCSPEPVDNRYEHVGSAGQLIDAERASNVSIKPLRTQSGLRRSGRWSPATVNQARLERHLEVSRQQIGSFRATVLSTSSARSMSHLIDSQESQSESLSTNVIQDSTENSHSLSELGTFMDSTVNTDPNSSNSIELIGRITQQSNSSYCSELRGNVTQSSVSSIAQSSNFINSIGNAIKLSSSSIVQSENIDSTCACDNGTNCSSMECGSVSGGCASSSEFTADIISQSNVEKITQSMDLSAMPADGLISSQSVVVKVNEVSVGQQQETIPDSIPNLYLTQSNDQNIVLNENQQMAVSDYIRGSSVSDCMQEITIDGLVLENHASTSASSSGLAHPAGCQDILMKASFSNTDQSANSVFNSSVMQPEVTGESVVEMECLIKRRKLLSHDHDYCLNPSHAGHLNSLQIPGMPIAIRSSIENHSAESASPQHGTSDRTEMRNFAKNVPDNSAAMTSTLLASRRINERRMESREIQLRERRDRIRLLLEDLRGGFGWDSERVSSRLPGVSMDSTQNGNTASAESEGLPASQASGNAERDILLEGLEHLREDIRSMRRLMNAEDDLLDGQPGSNSDGSTSRLTGSNISMAGGSLLNGSNNSTSTSLLEESNVDLGIGLFSLRPVSDTLSAVQGSNFRSTDRLPSSASNSSSRYLVANQGTSSPAISISQYFSANQSHSSSASTSSQNQSTNQDLSLNQLLSSAGSFSKRYSLTNQGPFCATSSGSRYLSANQDLSSVSTSSQNQSTDQDRLSARNSISQRFLANQQLSSGASSQSSSTSQANSSLSEQQQSLLLIDRYRAMREERMNERAAIRRNIASGQTLSSQRSSGLLSELSSVGRRARVDSTDTTRADSEVGSWFSSSRRSPPVPADNPDNLSRSRARATSRRFFSRPITRPTGDHNYNDYSSDDDDNDDGNDWWTSRNGDGLSRRRRIRRYRDMLYRRRLDAQEQQVDALRRRRWGMIVDDDDDDDVDERVRWHRRRERRERWRHRDTTMERPWWQRYNEGEREGERQRQDLDGHQRFQAAINRAISGAFLSHGEPSIASNITDQTYRIQRWDFIDLSPPDITDSGANIVVRRAKLHNDAGVDISQDGRLLCVFLPPTGRTASGDVRLGVFSLDPSNCGQCLYVKTFGPNAVSVSISPCNNFVLVGLASKRFTWIFSPKQMVAQVFHLKNPRGDEESVEHVCDIVHPCDVDLRAPVSLNSARWLSGSGEGLVYGTNRGDLNIYRPGYDQQDKGMVIELDISAETNPLRRNLMQLLGLGGAPRTMSTATQTALNVLRSASTQTEQRAETSGSVTDRARSDDGAGPSWMNN